MMRPATSRVLIVDDEPDMHAVTKLSLKTLKHRDKPLEIGEALSGKAAIEDLRARPDTAVVLLDVVMETPTAGLDACKAIRGELGNRFVRILLRTGQPGVAPERKTIDDYDIDGYLPKAELTSNRLYAAVRTALRAWDELVELEQHRSVLTFLHSQVAAMRAFEPLEATLRRVLETAVALAQAPAGFLELDTFGASGEPRRIALDLAPTGLSEARKSEIRSKARNVSGALDGGWVVPIIVHRELGQGFLFLEKCVPDALAQKVLPLLGSHSQNAVYAAVAREMLEARHGPFHDSLTV